MVIQSSILAWEIPWTEEPDRLYSPEHDSVTHHLKWDSQVVLVVKKPLANEVDTRDTGSPPGSGISPGEGNGNPLQFSCLESPMDREAWWTTAHGVAKSCTRLK